MGSGEMAITRWMALEGKVMGDAMGPVEGDGRQILDYPPYQLAEA